MSEIDIIITRHGKKDPSVEADCKVKGIPFVAGGDIDRTEVGLSTEGAKEVEEIGRTQLTGKTHDVIFVATSDFLRTDQTASAILRGAGYDPEELRDGRRASFERYDRIGLSGTNWKSVQDEKGETVPFGAEQTVLNRYVNTVLGRYFLERADQPGNPQRNPVMARRGAALLETLLRGVDDMNVRLKPQQRGLILIVTHAPTIDALSTVYGDKLEFINVQEAARAGFLAREGAVRGTYMVHLKPIDAHNEGQFMKGVMRANGFEIPLSIKGKDYVRSPEFVLDLARRMKHAAYHGVQ